METRAEVQGVATLARAEAARAVWVETEQEAAPVRPEVAVRV